MGVLARTRWRPPGAQRFEQLLCLISYASPVSRIQSLILILTQGLQLDCNGSYCGNFGNIIINLFQKRCISVGIEATFDTSPRILKELLAKLFVFFALYVNPRRLIITSENISLQIFNKSLRLNVRAIPAFSQTLRFSYSIWRRRINKFRSWNQGGFAGLAEFSVLPCVRTSFPEQLV